MLLSQLPSRPTTRFAPSPTGYLHLGHVASALYVWGIARATNGRVLLRIEDHDRTRCRPEYEQAILDDLDWLGLIPDGVLPRQSDRDQAYRQALAHLQKQHHIYACSCSRKDITAHLGAELEDELRYPGLCRQRGLELHTPHTGIRLQLQEATIHFNDLLLGTLEQIPSRQCGDLLLRDRHQCWTYQFCVVVDDCEQGIDLVIRGQDLTHSTGRQIQLARLLGRQRDALFLHHPLITDRDGRKLGKRYFSEAIAKRRAAGISASEIIGEAAFHLGFSDTRTSMTLTSVWDAIAAKFELKQQLPEQRQTLP